MDMYDHNKELAQNLVDRIWDLFRQSPCNIFDLYFCVLYVLYGIHKNYPMEVRNDNYNEIVIHGENDALLNDLHRFVSEKTIFYASREFSKFSHDVLKVLLDGNRESFEACYFDVLYQLNYKLVMNGPSMGEFLTPDAITRLIAYIVNKEGCSSVYDPFCGSASIVHFLHKENRHLSFVGQDCSEMASLVARLNAEVYLNTSISRKDSIVKWDESHFDAVISCPPFGIRFSEPQRQMLAYEYGGLNNNVEEVFFSRAFQRNAANLVVALLPLSFCQSQQYKNLRTYLVKDNYLDTIIFLPDRLLFNTSMPCVLVVCKRHRKVTAPIKLIDAQSFFTGDSSRTREFDLDTFIGDYEMDVEKICSLASFQDVVECEFNLNLYLYSQRKIELLEGQKMVTFGSLMTEAQRERVPASDTHKVFPSKNFSQDFIEVLLKKNSLVPFSEERSTSPRKLVKVEKGKKYLLSTGVVRSSKPKYAIYTDNEDFSCTSDIVVFEVNEELVSVEYLAYLLINSPVLKTGNFPLTNVAKLHTAIDSPDNQREIVGKLKQEHAAREKAEQEADAKRLGVKTNISDLEHMLGTTYANMDDVIYRLGKISSEDDVLKSLVKELKDNVDYLKRVIRYDNASISAEEFSFKEQDMEAFIQSYCESWKNYSGKYFKLSLQVNLGEHKMVVFDKTLMKVMLDSILSNAERHGFDKRRNEANQVEITLSLEKYEEKPFVVIRVANNGAPFKDFKINDYITRGRYSSKSGRSGLGGYHVYQIVKGHRGFLYLDSNKIWNVIVEVLLPINNVETDNLVDYEHECI